MKKNTKTILGHKVEIVRIPPHTSNNLTNISWYDIYIDDVLRIEGVVIKDNAWDYAKDWIKENMSSNDFGGVF